MDSQDNSYYIEQDSNSNNPEQKDTAQINDTESNTDTTETGDSETKADSPEFPDTEENEHTEIPSDPGVIDQCPDDPNKTEPGLCGCNLTEDDCTITSILGVEDAMVHSSYPNDNLNSTTLRIDDDDSGGHTYVLIKPEDLDAIPPDSTIISALLVIEIFNSGNTISVQKILGPWNETAATFNTAPPRSAEVATMSSNIGTSQLDVTSFMEEWISAGDSFGLALYPTGGNGVELYASEYEDLSLRPYITVQYFP